VYETLNVCSLWFVSDTGPISLIDAAFPRIDQLPDGASVVYDVTTHVHALQFLPDTKHMMLPTRTIFKSCQYFPEEFSVFFVIKHVPTSKTECVLTITHLEHIYIAVCLSQKRIIFTYDNKRIRFRNSVLRTNKWHTIGFSVTGSHVTMTTDCLNVRRHRLKRPFPRYLEISESVINIGNCEGCSRAFQVSRLQITWIRKVANFY